jgi:hypothetical protein
MAASSAPPCSVADSDVAETTRFNEAPSWLTEILSTRGADDEGSRSLLQCHGVDVNFPDPLIYNYPHMIATRVPSTNIPVQCPACPSKPMPQFFWAHGGIESHWNRAHASIRMPAELKEKTAVSGQQRDRLRKFARASAPSAQRVARRATAKAAS